MPISQRTLAPGDDRYGLEKLTNPGFETAGGGGADVFGTWTEVANDGAIADETVVVHSGGHAAKLTGGATQVSQVYQDVVVVPGATYQFTFWTRGDGTNSGFSGVYDATNAAWIVGQATTGVPGTTYTQVSIPFTAPAGCILVTTPLYSSNVNGGIVYFDDVSVKQIMGI